MFNFIKRQAILRKRVEELERQVRGMEDKFSILLNNLSQLLDGIVKKDVK